MIGVSLLCIFGVLIVCAALRYQLKSTPTHLVLHRRRRPTTDKVLLAHAATVNDVRETRRLEWEVYGRYYTSLDGSQIPDGDPVAFAGEPVKAKEPDGTPCWCNYCKGRVGVHGPEAVALYKAQADAAFAQSRYRQKLTNVRAGGHVTQVVSAGRNIVIAGDGAGVIVTGDNTTVVQSYGDLTPQDIAGMDMQEWAELRRHMDKLGYDLSRAIDRATRGMFG